MEERPTMCYKDLEERILLGGIGKLTFELS